MSHSHAVTLSRQFVLYNLQMSRWRADAVTRLDVFSWYKNLNVTQKRKRYFIPLRNQKTKRHADTATRRPVFPKMRNQKYAPKLIYYYLFKQLFQTTLSNAEINPL